jgi:hypothetical protein
MTYPSKRRSTGRRPGSAPKALEVVVVRPDRSKLDRKRVYVHPDDGPGLTRRMASIIARADGRPLRDVTDWIGEYELEVYEPGGNSPLFTYSAIGDEEYED